MKRFEMGVLVLAVLGAMGPARPAKAVDAVKPFPEFSAARAITTGPHDHFLANYFGINAWSPLCACA